MTPDQLIKELSQVVDSSIARESILSYIEMEQRFLAGDWSPTGLSGGRLCEAVSRGIYQLDTGVVNHNMLPGGIGDYILRQKNAAHNLDYPDRQHIMKMIESIYKLRSDRGFVHISTKHDANYLESMLIIHGAKWILSDFLRIAWNDDKLVVGEVISSIAQMENSLIHELDGKPMVLSANVSVAEEVLLLLSHAHSNRILRSDLNSYMVGRKATAISTAISRLISVRQVRSAGASELVLTPEGQKRVRDVIAPKLLHPRQI